MNIHAEHLSLFWSLVGLLLCIVCLWRAARRAPWWHLRDPQDLNVLLCALFGVMFLWTLQAGFSHSLTLHLLGATLLTLMFGYAFAVLVLAVIMLSLTLYQGGSLLSLPWQILLLGVLPAAVSYTVFRLSDRFLPNNFFVYIFICAFFGAALTIVAAMTATTVLHYASGAFSLAYLSQNYFRYTLLLIFPEAFITGMLMTIFVAYRPHWVSTFSDRRYLQHKDQQPH